MFFPMLNNMFYYPYSFYGYKIYRYYNNSPFNFEYINNNRHDMQDIYDISNLKSNEIDNNKLEDLNLLDNNITDNIENTNKINILGFNLNIDDLVIIFVLFTLFREESIDFSVIIALFVILFDQG